MCARAIRAPAVTCPPRVRRCCEEGAERETECGALRDGRGGGVGRGRALARRSLAGGLGARQVSLPPSGSPKRVTAPTRALLVRFRFGTDKRIDMLVEAACAEIMKHYINRITENMCAQHGLPRAPALTGARRARRGRSRHFEQRLENCAEGLHCARVGGIVCVYPKSTARSLTRAPERLPRLLPLEPAAGCSFTS